MKTRTRCHVLVLLTTLIATTANCAPSSSKAEPQLAQRLESLLAEPPLARKRVSALVVRQRDGAVVFEHDPTVALMPASNLKVLTSLAALSALGPTHRFETEVLADRTPDENGRVDTLYVRGGGDPSLTTEDWWRLAAQLYAAGLRRIDGELVLDDTAFDDQRWNPDWGRVGFHSYHAPVGALVANQSSFSVSVGPGPTIGSRPEVRVEPALPYLKVVNEARTVDAERRKVLQVIRESADRNLRGLPRQTGFGPTGTGMATRSEPSPPSETVRIIGAIPLGSAPELAMRAVREPALYAGAVLGQQLAAHGIEWSGAMRADRAPDDAIPVSVYKGRPLSEIVRRFLKRSQNAVGESLVKTLGSAEEKPGSWKTGLPLLRSELAGLGVALDRASIRDGSGLARSNRVSARTMVDALLAGGRSFRFGPEFVSSLSIAGRDGTLEKRAEQSVDLIRAKTGTLDSVSCLSGFARLESDPREVLVFSILVNGGGAESRRMQDAIDAFASTIAGPAVSQPASSEEAVALTR